MCSERVLLTTPCATPPPKRWESALPRTTQQRHAGFTLIEVLVALAVLTIALAALVHDISVHVNNTAYLRERTLAHWVATNKANEMQLGGTWPGPSTQKGDTLMAKQQWYWQVNISETEDADVRRMDVSVYAHEKDRNALATLVAYLGRPAVVTVGTGPAP